MSAIDDRTSDVFREVYERLDTESPEAPEWSAIPMSGFRPFPVWRGAFVAATVAAVVLLVIGVTALVAPWQRSATSPVGSTDIEGVIVAAYLADDIDADQLAVVTETLTTAPGVIDWRYISKTEAYEEKMVEWADREDYIEILRDNPDILPASIRLLTGNQTDAKAVEMLIHETLPMPTSGVMGLAVARGTLSNVELGFGYTGNSPFAALHAITEGWVAVAYLDDGVTAGQRQRMIDTLGTQRGVIEVLSVDKATALEEARILFAADPDVIRVLEVNPDLLPASIRVLTEARRQADAIAATADTLTGVMKTKVYRGALMRTEPLPPPVVDTSGGGNTTMPSATCPVTIPPLPGFTPPEGYSETPTFGVWYGTKELWTVLEIDGSYRPRKSVFWSARFLGGVREAQPDIRVTWKRLDTTDAPLTNNGLGTNAYTPEDGSFMIAGLDPDEPGCWEATATYKRATLSYVYLVP